MGTFPVEQRWFQKAPHFFSVHLADIQVPSVCVNGKGSTRWLALASAYGELMERLQNGFLWPKAYGLMEDRPFFHPDESMVPVGAMLSDAPEGVLHLLDAPNQAHRLSGSQQETSLRAAPFYSVAQQRVVHLPIGLLHAAVWTNGACAGNTPEEALTHGLCEIMERFVTREVFLDHTLRLPNVPLEHFRSTRVFPMLKAVQEHGYELVIKDCTLGGRFPVLGVLLRPSGASGYSLRLGSHPLLDVALERCLTEVFQGIGQEEEVPLSKLDANGDAVERASAKRHLLEYLAAQPRWIPERLLLESEHRFDLAPFTQRSTSNRAFLRRLTMTMRRMGYDIYLRDVSFLGFPSYYVYVPPLSLLLPEEVKAFRTILDEGDFLKRCLLRIKECSRDELLRCAKFLEQIPLSTARSLSNLTDTRFTAQPLFPELSVEHVLFYLYGRAREFKKARRYLEEYLGQHPGLLQSELGQLLLRGIQSGARGFDGFPWPMCGDCATCPAGDQCSYETWCDVSTKLQRRMESNPLDQADPGRLF